MKLTVLAIVGVLMGIGFAGKSDFEEAKRHESAYCEMVKKGYWGDYDKSIKCEE